MVNHAFCNFINNKCNIRIMPFIYRLPNPIVPVLFPKPLRELGSNDPEVPPPVENLLGSKVPVPPPPLVKEFGSNVPPVPVPVPPLEDPGLNPLPEPKPLEQIE